jgi:hypothetical protein
VHTLTAWYSLGQGESGHVIHDGAELDAMLDHVTHLARADWPVLSTLSRAAAGPVLYVGFHGPVGTLLHASLENGRQFSRGQAGDRNDEPILYMYMTSADEFPANSEIPVDLVRRAAHYFAETEGRLPEVVWQEWTPTGSDSGSEFPGL